jgi:hypothetical protein
MGYCIDNVLDRQITKYIKKYLAISGYLINMIQGSPSKYDLT